MKIKPKELARRVSLLYCLVAGVWITLSDGVVAGLIPELEEINHLQLYKDLAFVGITAVLLHTVLRRAVRHWEREAEERARAEAKEREHQMRLAAIMNSAMDAIITVDEAQRIVLFNRAAEQVFGWHAAELIGQPVDRLLPERFRAAHAEKVRAFGASSDTSRRMGTSSPLTCLRASGEEFSSEITLSKVTVDGRLYLTTILRDITERKRAEEKLRESENRFRLLYENSPYCVHEIDLEGRLTLMNRAGLNMMGVQEERAVCGTPYLSAVADEDKERIDRLLHLALQGQASEFEFKASNGHVFQSSFVPITDAQGKVVRLMGLTQDITERKRTEESLRLFRVFVDRSNDAFEVIDPATGRFLDMNDKGCADLGYSREEILTRRVLDVDPTVEPEMWPELVKRVCAEKFMLYDGIHRRKDGTTFPVEVNASCIHLDREYIVTIVRDVTERKQTEAQLRLQSAALAASANAIVITNREGVIEWVNPAFTTFTGYTLAEAVGRKPGELIRSGKQNREFYQQLWDTIRAGRPWRGEVVNRRKDGSTYHEEMTITPVCDRNNEITHFIAIKQDISGKKDLEAHLLRTQRLESVGRLASGIAHDLNNVLTPMLMAPQILRTALTDPNLIAMVDTIEASAERGASIIKQLLAFGRGLQGERVPVQLRSLVRDMVKIIEEVFPKNITAHQNIPRELPLINGDATQLHQVLMNLCVNARDAMPGGGSLTLALAEAPVDEAMARANPGARPGPYVVLGVTDTGTGIAPEHLDKIYDPFFTTKKIGEGTGLGLSTTIGIVQYHQGFIQVSSKIGHGTQFRIFLPVVETPGPTKEQRAAAELPMGRREMILVVDDEDIMRQITRRMLEQRGYRVIEAKNGTEALEVYEANRNETRAVVTDVMMPVSNGLTLIRALQRVDAPVKIIVMTGFLSEPEMLEELRVSSEAVLSKPFSASALLQALEKALRPALS